MNQLANSEECQLLIPMHDEKEPELSIVIPALNEELTIATFLDWCMEGIKKAGISAEILIIDSSQDDTAQIALNSGARVLKTPRRGLGRAYIDALPYIRGKYVLMGDSDCTYDFRQISPFVGKFKQGYEYIMGSRFGGHIEKGAMPTLHRYFGIPLTTIIYNIIYGQKFTDIHCGMRGITLDALKRMELQSQSWEYASEMVVKSRLLRLHITEVPIDFYKDQKGRLSHHKRLGFLSPWLAGWINLRVMLTYGADFFLLKPGILIALIGICFLVYSVSTKQSFDNQNIPLLILFASVLSINLGASFFYSGLIVRTLYNFVSKNNNIWLKPSTYNCSIFVSTVLACLAIMILCLLVGTGVLHKLTNLFDIVFPFVLISLMLTLAFVNFSSTLIMQAIADVYAARTKN